MDHTLVLDWVDAKITSRPWSVVIVFFVLTAVFVTGLGAVETEAGQEQFIEDLPSFDTLEDVQQDFNPSFTASTSSTTLLQRGENVLSKPELLRMLRVQYRLTQQDDLRLEGTSSAARTVARTLDPDAATLEAQIDAIERATPTQIDAAVRRAADSPAFTDQLSTDFNRRSASASAALSTVTHSSSDIPGKESQVRHIAAASGGDIQPMGSAPDTITDTLLLVLPASFLLIVLFLIVAYRDPIDLILGIISILMTILWTFGFLGLVGIPFNPLLVAVPPLLIAVGIDFGIHAINRYREELDRGQDIRGAMRTSNHQLLVAFFIVMATTTLGFLSNLVSALPPIQDFGVVAAMGIVFTFLIFGIFLPAFKVGVDRLRQQYPIPTISQSPLGSEESILGVALSGGAVIGRRAPAVFMLAVLLLTLVAGSYATGVETGFSPDDFLPAEEPPDFLLELPEPFKPPEEFEYVKKRNYRQEHFQEDDTILMFIEGPLKRDSTLESIHQAGANPPETIRQDRRHADAQSIVSIIRARAERDPEFRSLVQRNDRTGNGIPDDNLDEVYSELFGSPASTQALNFMAEDRRSALVIYSVDDDADVSHVTADAREVASRHRHDASPTGFAVIFDEATDLVFETVIQTLVITLVSVTIFLVLIYWVLEGRPSLGIANAVPIGITVVFVVASMRFFGIKFNAINGTILALTIGLGIDYSVHIVHRFVDERQSNDRPTALRRTVIGTGGALTGSMLTTVAGIGVLALALNPAIGVFGLLTALSVIFAYTVALFVLPATLVLWDRWVGDR